MKNGYMTHTYKVSWITKEETSVWEPQTFIWSSKHPFPLLLKETLSLLYWSKHSCPLSQRKSLSSKDSKQSCFLLQRERYYVYLPKLFTAQTSFKRHLKRKNSQCFTCHMYSNMWDTHRIAFQQYINMKLLEICRLLSRLSLDNGKFLSDKCSPRVYRISHLFNWSICIFKLHMCSWSNVCEIMLL